MNIQRFHAPTAREALALARQTFGEGTLILSNRPTANGVEVVATAEDNLAALRPTSLGTQASTLAHSSADDAVDPDSSVNQDTQDMAMSTLSFQSYVRERMLRRRQEELGKAKTTATQPAARASAPAPAAKARVLHADLIKTIPSKSNGAVSAPTAPTVAPSIKATPRVPAPPTVASPDVMRELQSMRELIEERFSNLSWLGQARQDPLQSNLMLKLIRAGYSPSLSRSVLERMPAALDPAQAMRWMLEVLERNLKTDAGQTQLLDEGGCFALVGATGVGKTTTVAKLAAQCARTHGAASVGLITLDTYRVAALEQLRSYGRSLGIVAHLAHDRAALQDLLNLFSNKKMILIDTAGLAPRDPRMRDIVDDALKLPRIKRVLVLNAANHGDTMDDVLAAFKQVDPVQVILSKIDEAVKLGPSLDALIRHQAVLRGVTNGQRVPEDWERADPSKLVRLSMQSLGRSAHEPKPEELNFFFAPASTQPLLQGALHA